MGISFGLKSSTDYSVFSIALSRKETDLASWGMAAGAPFSSPAPPFVARTPVSRWAFVDPCENN